MSNVVELHEPRWRITPSGREQFQDLTADEVIARYKDESLPLEDRIMAYMEAHERGWA